jgi:23S rRNA pseudouridine1911/1915/1917 synthase
MEILYEDNHIIVVVKKPNIPSQEDDSKDLDMLTMVKNYVKNKYNKPGDVYIGLVHRLDRPVGGVMVFARTSKAASRLSEQIRNNMFDKEYVALVHGKTKDKEILENYLIKDEKTNTSKITNEVLGKKAILEYSLISYKNGLSLININLKTGRSHQIRVQLANINHPIYGDQKYGKDPVGIQIHLWAYKLEFVHPVKNEKMTFEYRPNWFNI